MTFKWGRRTYVMGIINATPDSFSGDGLLTHEDWIVRAVAHARRFVEREGPLLRVFPAGGHPPDGGGPRAGTVQPLLPIVDVADVRALAATLVCCLTHVA